MYVLIEIDCVGSIFSGIKGTSVVASPRQNGILE